LLLMIIILSKTNQVLFFTRNYFRRKDLYLFLMIIILSKTNRVRFLHVIIFPPSPNITWVLWLLFSFFFCKSAIYFLSWWYLVMV